MRTNLRVKWDFIVFIKVSTIGIVADITCYCRLTHTGLGSLHVLNHFIVVLLSKIQTIYYFRFTALAMVLSVHQDPPLTLKWTSTSDFLSCSLDNMSCLAGVMSSTKKTFCFLTFFFLENNFSENNFSRGSLDLNLAWIKRGFWGLGCFFPSLYTMSISSS